MKGLSLTNVHKTYGETHALAGVSLELQEGETVALLGPSGSGKSTLLMVIAGLETPDRGEILWDGRPVKNTPPYRRGFGLMFQDFALFPHRNVQDNVAFGLQMLRWPKEETRERVTEVLKLVGLPGFERRDVNTLSGGEQQRVALARSLAPRPRLLMLDEPLGSLDRNLRERLVDELREILQLTHQTALYVTHDQEEAFTLADRVMVMNAGRSEQVDTPQAIYTRPASVFVARFLGLSNLLPGEARRVDGQSVVETAIGRLPVQTEAQGEVTVLLRPDGVHLNEEGECQLSGVVSETSFRGRTCRAVVHVDGVALTFDFPAGADLPAPGETVRLGFDPTEAVQVFPGKL